MASALSFLLQMDYQKQDSSVDDSLWNYYIHDCWLQDTWNSSYNTTQTTNNGTDIFINTGAISQFTSSSQIQPYSQPHSDLRFNDIHNIDSDLHHRHPVPHLALDSPQVTGKRNRATLSLIHTTTQSYEESITQLLKKPKHYTPTFKHEPVSLPEPVVSLPTSEPAYTSSSHNSSPSSSLASSQDLAPLLVDAHQLALDWIHHRKHLPTKKTSLQVVAHDLHQLQLAVLVLIDRCHKVAHRKALLLNSLQHPQQIL